MEKDNILKVKQTTVYNLLERSIKKNRLAHAYLFVGEQGVGKKEMAFLLVKALLCENKHDEALLFACETCEQCRKVNSSMHSDVFFVAPDGQHIKKESVQALRDDFWKKGLESNKKFYIIKHIEKMTTVAANSLLKFIEEPTGETFFILMTRASQQVLPTIISRCQVVRFLPLNSLEFSAVLCEAGVDTNTAYLLSNLTSKLDEAINYYNDEWFKEAKRLVLCLIDKLGKSSCEAVSFIHEEWMSHFDDKKKLELGLELLLINFRKLLNEKNNVNRTLTSINIAEIVQSIALAKQQLSSNVNQHLHMDQLVIKICQGFLS